MLGPKAEVAVTSSVGRREELQGDRQEASDLLLLGEENGLHNRLLPESSGKGKGT